MRDKQAAQTPAGFNCSLHTTVRILCVCILQLQVKLSEEGRVLPRPVSSTLTHTHRQTSKTLLAGPQGEQDGTELAQGCQELRVELGGHQYVGVIIPAT